MKIVAALAVGVLAFSSTSNEAAAATMNELVARGEYLARAGDCVACHSAPGEQPYSGGAAINSPFGPIYAPNLTPDKVTGIGDWSDDEFYRAMHEGIGKHGENLYPAFPYQWFTKITRDDVLAIKTYLGSLPAVNRQTPQTRLMFPFNVRSGIAAWNAAFFHAGEYIPNPDKSVAINRGAYLVEGLGHCADCHTPKGVGMSPIESRAYSGGSIDDWYAPNITSDAKSGIGGWLDKDLAEYLKTGSAPGKGVVVGPMAQVVHDSLAYLTDADIDAIVLYLKDLPPISDATPRQSATSDPRAVGESAYISNCAFCHGLDGKGRDNAVPALDGSDLVRAKGPEDVIRVILGGRLAHASYAPMPPVGADLSDAEIAHIVTYVRNAWSNNAPASDKGGLVGKIRDETFGILAQRVAANSKTDPCFIGDDDLPIEPIDDPEHQIERMIDDMRPTTMRDVIDRLVARVRSIAPDRTHENIINGLTQAYCRAQVKSGTFGKAEARRALAQFSQLIFTELSTNGKD